MQSGMRRYASALVSAGYDPAPISQAFGIPLQELGVTAQRRGDPVRTQTPDGRTIVGQDNTGPRSGTREAPVLVDTPEGAAQLPPGTFFRTPDGRLMQRPAQ